MGLVGVLFVGAVAAMVWFALFDAPYDVAAWAEANPARVDRTAGTPLLEEHDCPFAGEPGSSGVRCATLVVPADRHDPANDAVVDLAVAILPATGPSPQADPVVYLEGGPGGASVAWFDMWVDPPWSHLRRDREVILLDQRGTGYSTPTLGCQRAWEATRLGYADAVIACREEAVSGGAVLTGISTREHAADVADLRIELGVDEWNLYGVSYGTRVALAVLRDHPTGVRSVVLDSVYPADVAMLAEQGEVAVAAFDALAEACIADAVCRTLHGDPRQQLAAAAAALDAAPVTIEGEQVEGADLVDEIIWAMYDTTLLTELPRVIATAVDDPADAFEQLGWWDVGPPAPSALRRAGAPPSPRRTVAAYEDSDGTFYAVECREEVAVADQAEARARAAALPAPFADAALRQLDDMLHICRDHGSGAAGPAELAPATSDVPTLLLAGGMDPVTPPRWAHQAAETLSNSTVLEFPAVGHAVLLGGACPGGLVVDFFADPSTTADPSCAAGFDRPSFVP